MSKVELDRVESGFGLIKINTNFQKIQDELNDRVLYRASPEGEPNSMQSTLDMNGQDLINIGTLAVANLDISGVNLAEQVALAQDAAIAAEASNVAAAEALSDVTALASTVQDNTDIAVQAAEDAAASAASIDLTALTKQVGGDVGAADIATGSTAERPTGEAGLFRFNTDTGLFEGHDGTIWGAVGKGATGGGGNTVFFENDIAVTQDYTITSGKNAMTAGPVTIDDDVTVTVPDGSTWTIV